MRLTKCERRLPRSVRRRYERCVKKVKRQGGTRSPYAICRKAVFKKCR